MPSGVDPLKAAVRIIAGGLHSPDDSGPLVSDLLDSVNRRKWHVFDRTAHADHGDAPKVPVLGKLGQRRIRLVEQRDHRR